ncbi:MAG: hypothetical protein R3F61_20215 [Myxococcota bacterium]
MRFVLLAMLVGCGGEPEVDQRVGACVLLNGGTADHPEPFEYCHEYEAYFCQDLLDDFATGTFEAGETCSAAGFPICCQTSGPWDQWHENQEQADAARQSVSGEDCEPC